MQIRLFSKNTVHFCSAIAEGHAQSRVSSKCASVFVYDFKIVCVCFDLQKER